MTSKRKEPCNVILPNGDVLLCCNDYGMQHALGNFMTSDYPALHPIEEFLKAATGLADETIEILCRRCDVDVMENRIRAAQGHRAVNAVEAA